MSEPINLSNPMDLVLLKNTLESRWIKDRSGKLILMQFIGFKDKNGKEIYEGDIVECKAVGKPYQLTEIKWNEYNLGWYFSHPGTNFIQVIGNIYENPELLK